MNTTDVRKKIEDKIKALQDALKVIDEMDGNNVVISEPKFNYSTTVKKRTLKKPMVVKPIKKKRTTRDNKKEYLVEIMESSGGKEMSTPEVRQRYAQKVGKREEEVEKYVENALRFLEEDGLIVRKQNPNGRGKLNKYKTPMISA